jgi:hypothetical protein
MGMPKAKSIYIFGAKPQAGKSVVPLGIMELLLRSREREGRSSVDGGA